MNSNMVIKSKSLNQQFDEKKKNEIRVYIKRLIRLDLFLIVRELVCISNIRRRKVNQLIEIELGILKGKFMAIKF